MMKNAKEELISILGIASKLECALITVEDPWGDVPSRPPILLKKGYSPQDFENFLNEMDFKYDCGWGTQYLFGTLWLENGQWAARAEYDGSEWWQIFTLPEIPVELEIT